MNANANIKVTNGKLLRCFKEEG